MNRFLLFLIPASIFLLTKLHGIGVRLSDTNIYFYTAHQLLQGQVLYKDVFFTNFPLIPYAAVFYFLISGGNLVFYFFTATLEAIAVAFIIYLLVLREKNDTLLATISSSIYLFSFIILTTSDHQSGVFLASLFAVVSYYFFTIKRFIVSGVFIALTLMTKAYFAPVFIALSVVLFLNKKRSLMPFFLSFVGSVLIVLAPSLLLAPYDLYKDIVLYSLTRTEGIEKIHILRFFVLHDLLFIVLFVYTIARIRTNTFLGSLSLAGLVFVLFYKDIYYLYLNFLVPFLALAFADFYSMILNRLSVQKFIMPTVLVIVFCINIGIYLSRYQNLQRLQDLPMIVQFLQMQPNTLLYGTNDITPALAYLTDKKLLGNIVDTNANIFRKGFLDKKELTQKAIDNGAIIVTHGATYPHLGITEHVVSEIVDRESVVASCKLIQSVPISTEGVENRLNFFSCKD